MAVQAEITPHKGVMVVHTQWYKDSRFQPVIGFLIRLIEYGREMFHYSHGLNS